MYSCTYIRTKYIQIRNGWPGDIFRIVRKIIRTRYVHHYANLCIFICIYIHNMYEYLLVWPKTLYSNGVSIWLVFVRTSMCKPLLKVSNWASIWSVFVCTGHGTYIRSSTYNTDPVKAFTPYKLIGEVIEFHIPPLLRGRAPFLARAPDVTST